jgi:hypothetical protein
MGKKVYEINEVLNAKPEELRAVIPEPLTPEVAKVAKEKYEQIKKLEKRIGTLAREKTISEDKVKVLNLLETFYMTLYPIYSDRNLYSEGLVKNIKNALMGCFADEFLFIFAQKTEVLKDNLIKDDLFTKGMGLVDLKKEMLCEIDNKGKNNENTILKTEKEYKEAQRYMNKRKNLQGLVGVFENKIVLDHKYNKKSK